VSGLEDGHPPRTRRKGAILDAKASRDALWVMFLRLLKKEASGGSASRLHGKGRAVGDEEAQQSRVNHGHWRTFELHVGT